MGGGGGLRADGARTVPHATERAEPGLLGVLTIVGAGMHVALVVIVLVWKGSM